MADDGSTILAIDPSSTRSGWAVMAGVRDLTAYGAVIGDKKLDALPRAVRMADSLVRIAQYRQPSRIVIEVPSARVYGGRPGSGLTLYGQAVGVIYATLLHSLPQTDLISVKADVWTRQLKKQHRLLCVKSDFPAYARMRDAAGDIGDAIALGQWWFRERGLHAR